MIAAAKQNITHQSAPSNNKYDINVQQKNERTNSPFSKILDELMKTPEKKSLHFIYHSFPAFHSPLDDDVEANKSLDVDDAADITCEIEVGDDEENMDTESSLDISIEFFNKSDTTIHESEREATTPK